MTIRLQKCATVTGRVVDDDGRPRAAWISGYIPQRQLDIAAWISGSIPQGQLGMRRGGGLGVGLGIVRAGKDGRFRMEGIIPGLKIGLLAGKNLTYFDTLVPELTLKPGEVKDLGDVSAKPSQ